MFMFHVLTSTTIKTCYIPTYKSSSISYFVEAEVVFTWFVIVYKIMSGIPSEAKWPEINEETACMTSYAIFCIDLPIYMPLSL